MKTIKNRLLVGLLVLTGSISVGCDDDKFLEENPPTFYTTDNIFTTSAQVDQVITSIYHRVRYIWTNDPISHDYFNFKGKGTDLLDITYSKRGNGFSDYSLIDANHSTFSRLYGDFYQIIARANLAIHAAELPNISWASANDKAYTLAQARFFRALAYRNLGELFGGVPLVTEIVETPRFDFVRNTRLETYQYAIDELEDILNDLPETTAHSGRIVRAAAQHNLCELYLAKGIQMEAEGGSGAADYTQAITYASQVIDGGLYSLMTGRFGKRSGETTISIDIHPRGELGQPVVDTIMLTTNHYWDLFQKGNINYNDGNKESIWAVQTNYAAYHNGDGQAKLPYSQAYSPVLRDGSNGHIAGMLEDIGGRPNSQTTQNWYVRDSIWQGKWGSDLRNSEIVFRRRFKGNVPPDANNPRPYYLKPIPWSELYYGNANELQNTNNQNMCFPLSCKICTDQYDGIEDGLIRQHLFRDDYVIRLPETILLRAEAKQRSGDKPGAAADINLLRSRSQCSYLVTAADVDDDFNLILDERARELLYEETRWNTFLRMGGDIAVNRILKYSFWPETQATLNFKFSLWPIPQSVIDVNTAVPMEQNPGWKDR
ncbi:MAG: RagB/SusD family nutrient uptake outer membrane protein [Bacteroidales bacterium]|jgi:hypothetical protein|nr:RagB/SusD family nutrient uptake outer membrane protein [Bacteroidales bacterium]